MSDTPPDNFDQLWRGAIENHISAMSDSDFQQLLARTRPPDYSKFTDPADRMRAVRASIVAKQRQRPKVDHNGHPIREGQADQAALDALDAQIKAAGAGGDHSRAIALKQAKRQQLKKGTPR